MAISLLIPGSLVLLGFVALVGGAEVMVRHAVALAQRLGVPAMLIALTIVALGTSLPELLVSLRAALLGYMGIALGNIVGSNIANILLILPAAGLILPFVCRGTGVKWDSLLLLLATGLFVGLALWSGATLARWHGAVFVAILVAYFLQRYLAARRDPAQADELSADVVPPPRYAFMARAPWLLAVTLAGLAVLLGGAELFVRGAVELARGAGIPESVIGLTVVALGTSLPELVTVVAAARRGHSEMAVGSAIGSNLFNILGVTGVTALVVPVVFPAKIVALDLWIMVGATVALLALTLTGARYPRWLAGLFLAAYALFVLAQGFGWNATTPQPGLTLGAGLP